VDGWPAFGPPSSLPDPPSGGGSEDRFGQLVAVWDRLGVPAGERLEHVGRLTASPASAMFLLDPLVRGLQAAADAVCAAEELTMCLRGLHTALAAASTPDDDATYQRQAANDAEAEAAALAADGLHLADAVARARKAGAAAVLLPSGPALQAVHAAAADAPVLGCAPLAETSVQLVHALQALLTFATDLATTSAASAPPLLQLVPRRDWLGEAALGAEEAMLQLPEVATHALLLRLPLPAAPGVSQLRALLADALRTCKGAHAAVRLQAVRACQRVTAAAAGDSAALAVLGGAPMPPGAVLQGAGIGASSDCSPLLVTLRGVPFESTRPLAIVPARLVGAPC